MWNICSRHWSSRGTCTSCRHTSLEPLEKRYFKAVETLKMEMDIISTPSVSRFFFPCQNLDSSHCTRHCEAEMKFLMTLYQDWPLVKWWVASGDWWASVIRTCMCFLLYSPMVRPCLFFTCIVRWYLEVKVHSLGCRWSCSQFQQKDNHLMKRRVSWQMPHSW